MEASMNPNLPPKVPQRDVFGAGMITSQIAAVIMAVVMMLVFALFLGKSPLYPVQVIGSTVYGEPALSGLNLKAVIAGLVLHLLVAAAWGIVFCIVASALDIRTALMAAIVGIIVAVVSMVDSYVFVPRVMYALYGTDIWNREVPMFWNWAAHIVFGASFGFYPVVLGWLLDTKHSTPHGMALR
jgi:hypothetical protein